MNGNIKMQFNNKYNIKLIDAASGDIKQEGNFHNIALNTFKSCIIGLSKASAGKATCGMVRLLSTLQVGSGTTEPAVTDTALASELWQVLADTRSFEWLDDYTCQATAVFTFPATTAYVGTVTEVGLKNCFYEMDSSIWDKHIENDANLLCTRALLTDSEGQQISFVKTDLDILQITVVVELSLSSLDANFTLFKNPFLVRNILVGTYLHSYDSGTYDDSFTTGYGYMNLCRFYHDLKNYLSAHGGYTYARNKIDSYVSDKPTGYWDDESAYVKYAIARMTAETIQTERYFKGIALPGIGYWQLPNENVFPAYNITGIHVGTGDGTTVAFLNPLSYFKKDTEKIYKNGVLLTRDVDYTINNVSDVNYLPEIAELLGTPTVTGGVDTVYKNASYHWWPFFNNTSIYHMDALGAFNADNPVLLEYEAPVTLNYLKSSGRWNAIYADGSSASRSVVPAGTVFYLDYSTDGEVYTELASYTLETAAADTDTVVSFLMEFAETTAKYWRLRTSYNTSNRALAMYAYYYNTVWGYINLGRRDPYITFTEAPLDSDVITMDVEMDLIMKNSNFVIDLGCRLDFSM